MTQHALSAPRYVVTAKSQNGLIRQTRVMAASAVVLARSWQDAGYSDVEVIAPSGKTLSPEGYRESVLNGRRRR